MTGAARDKARACWEQAVALSDHHERTAASLHVSALKLSGDDLKFEQALAEMNGCHARHWRRAAIAWRVVVDEMET